MATYRNSLKRHCSSVPPETKKPHNVRIVLNVIANILAFIKRSGHHVTLLWVNYLHKMAQRMH